jgi:hypothetical protein
MADQMGWFRYFRRCSAAPANLPFLLMPLSQPHPRAAAVLVDEFDAGAFECAANRLESSAAWLACTCFELMDGHNPHLSALREFLLVPFQEAARCSALGGGNHPVNYATASNP